MQGDRDREEKQHRSIRYRPIDDPVKQRADRKHDRDRKGALSSKRQIRGDDQCDRRGQARQREPMEGRAPDATSGFSEHELGRLDCEGYQRQNKDQPDRARTLMELEEPQGQRRIGG